jgi:putative peptidoglycan lipid II flippase
VFHRAEGVLQHSDKPQPGPRTSPPTRGGAALVALGILCSRLAGLIRQRVFAHYFGQESAAADAFNAAFRIPNLLQNLFGEGALSGSFIPVYAASVARGDTRHAAHVAGAVAALLGLVTSIVVLLGVLAAPLLVSVIASGFTGDTRELTIVLVRILFPGAGLLVLSAWCLGILNSHHRFLLSYTAPVVWNVAMIAALIAFGAGSPLPELAVYLAWGSVAGSALQFAVQVPAVMRLVPALRLSLRGASPDVHAVMRNFGPVAMSRGVVQISAFVDTLIASNIARGAVTALANAQLIYTLPVSLFGMSVSAAQLPAMSGDAARDAASGSIVATALRDRLDSGLRQIAFFVIPSSVALVALGDVIAAGLFQTGRFTHDDAVYVWAILAGSAIGLLASTLGRLYASSCYAIRDTRTPLRFAVVRLSLSIVLGYSAALLLPRALAMDAKWGTAGLTAASGVAGWVEFLLLRSAVRRRVGSAGVPAPLLARLWLAAGVSAAVAWGVKIAVGEGHPLVLALAVLPAYASAYLGITYALGIGDVRSLAMRALRRR